MIRSHGLYHVHEEKSSVRVRGDGTAVLRAFVVAEIGLRVRYGKIERITGAGDWKRKTPASMHSNLVGYL